ncbi:MAG: hypothetical protein CSA24_00995 [Deltaproteobacteria bacterium]|nr:MAG: hypothetical protein CSB49_08500 [Pseudomonadota bacterium]PIE66064.1 MAG: hypothetical protein CSA24_00995 [Deltaproteobacteria bacterium]
MKTATLLSTAMVVGLLCSACGSSDDPHCRMYLVADSSGSFLSLHVVDSPARNSWGANLLNEPAEYLRDHPTWRVFRFAAGRTLDWKVDYKLGSVQRVADGEDNSCRDGKGLKLDIDGGYLFYTRFTFAH